MQGPEVETRDTASVIQVCHYRIMYHGIWWTMNQGLHGSFHIEQVT